MKIGNLAILGAAAVALGALTRRAQGPIVKVAGKVGDAVAAASPPSKSRNILVRVYQEAMEDRLFSVAAGLAFYALLSLVPSLAAAVSLFSLIADPEWLARMPSDLATLLPAEAVKLVGQEASRLASQPPQALSAKLAVALFLSLWSASAAVRAGFDALNVIDDQQETRSLPRLYATALAATLAGVIVLSLAVAVIGADPKFIAFGPVSSETVWLYGLLRWPLFFLVGVIVITTLYWIGPSRPPARFLALTPGAAFAALFWAIGSYAFGWYVATLGNYTATYGSLATVVVVMTWLWVSAAIILLGAQVNHALHRLGWATAQ